ncbi:hypothetical protein CHS0354_029410 [Potamilus streckersoni]|uniref:CEP170 C-terminal domain-containing protein n=1 Tax=Potamilus streckersoni TaxID=2493646 RepID=A0AAE0W1N1_9BIVA|nr:hypothetical protein CHS0354_029410 [Potamilus streckersoni]
MTFYMERFHQPDVHEHQQPHGVTSPHRETPTWGNGERSPMAECTRPPPTGFFIPFNTSTDDLGCIQEQQIQHTCSQQDSELTSAQLDLERSINQDTNGNFSFGCNTWPRKRSKARTKQHITAVFEMDVDQLDSVTSKTTRVLRGTGAGMNNLPPELATVKKGTPLYGQPTWWGDNEPSDLDTALISKDKSKSKMQEIPDKDYSPEKDTTSHCVSSSKSASSVSNVASQKPTNQNGISSVVQSVSLGEATPPRQSHTPEGSASMAFTVQFDETSPKNIAGPLSEFLPDKMKHHFKTRTEKVFEKSSKVTSKENVHSTQSYEVRSQSEGRDSSPTRQKQLDEIWSSVEGNRTKLQSKTGSGSVSSEQTEDKLDKVPVKGPSGKSTAIKRRHAVSGTSRARTSIKPRKSQSFDEESTQVSDSASYLIDKMFDITASQSIKSAKEETDQSSEYTLYKEARNYDLNSISKDKDRKSLTKASEVKSLETKIKSVTEKPPVSILKKSPENVPTSKADSEGSEAGTYTVEMDKDGKEEEKARRKIDRVFGVGTDIPDIQKSHIRDLPKEQMLENISLQDLDTEIDELEKTRACGAGNSLEVEIGSAVLEELRIVEKEEEEEENPTSSVRSDAPKWVSQWAALTNQKSCNKSGDMDEYSPGSSLSDQDKTEPRNNTKPPNGLSRKRPGTGRRLPSIPPEPTSPVNSESSKGSPCTRTSSHVSSPGLKSVKISSHVSSRYQDTDSESVSLTKYENNSVGGSVVSSRGGQRKSSGSVASLDTEILLKDTEVVMTAIEARMGSKSDKVKENGHISVSSMERRDSAGSDTDTSSMVALVNGDEDYNKFYYESPRIALRKGQLKEAKQSSAFIDSKPHVKSAGERVQTHHDTHLFTLRKELVEFEPSVVSDVLSGTERTTTVVSESLIDKGEELLVKQDSKGKGTISMTKPNRAFQLRRAHADNEEPSRDSPRSTASVGSLVSSNTSSVMPSSRMPMKAKRPGSGKLADKLQQQQRQTQQQISARSEQSLGAQIVRKSRENARSMDLSVALARTDGGRHSLRMSRTLSVPGSTPSTPSTPSEKSQKRKSDISASSKTSGLRHSNSLKVSGVSVTSKQSSQPPSRSNSPKSAERTAWKRRKDYDPRKAVAEAKGKVRDSTKPKIEMSITGSRRVTRSASFTNTRDLGLKLSTYKSDSVSSTDDISHRSSETSDTCDNTPRRGFVPYPRSVSTRIVYASSTEEEEQERVIRSTQSYDNIIVSSIYQLSLKLKTTMDRTLQKLRENEMVENGIQSPVSDLENDISNAEIPAYKSANQELAGILRNLRKIEQHLKVMNRVLFPDDDPSPESTRLNKEKSQYLQEIERIRSELAGFQPIDTPRTDGSQDENVSIESDCEELNQAEYY